MMEGVELCFPQLNTSCWRLKRSHTDFVIISIILSSISLLTVTLNLLVIISISHFRQLHTPTNLLLLSLAISDFFVGLFMLFHIMLIDGCWYLGDVICVLYDAFTYIITSASIGTMVLISVDRYVAICDPLHYSTKVTPTRAKICVSLCWACSALCHSLLLKDNLKQPGRYNSCSGECVIVVNHVAGFVDLCLSFIGPVTVIVALYLRIFMVVVSQVRAMQSHVAAVSQHSGKVTAKKSEMKAARTLGVVVVAFLICVCPFFCVILSGQDKLVNPASAAFVIILFDFNSCLNPLIYALFYPWFRKSIKLIVTLQVLKSGSSEANIV